MLPGFLLENLDKGNTKYVYRSSYNNEYNIYIYNIYIYSIYIIHNHLIFTSLRLKNLEIDLRVSNMKLGMSMTL